MSLVWMPPETVSVTKGIGNALCGVWVGRPLWLGWLWLWRDGKVVMLRAWERCGWRVTGLRKARRADLRIGSILMFGLAVLRGVRTGCDEWLYTEIAVKLLSTFGSDARNRLEVR